VNIIYENHISISLYADTKDKTNLKVFCLPQAYRDKVFGLKGNDIQNLAIKSLNSANDNLLNIYEKFIFVKCAYDLDNQVYYLESNSSDFTIKPEIIYKDIPNINPYKNFNIPKYSNVIVQNASLNSKVRIFMRTLNIYREFIPRGINLGRRILKDFIGPSFWPLTFTVDFNDYDAANSGLSYRFYDPEQNLNLQKFVASFLNGFKLIIYTTYPRYLEIVFCDFKNEYIAPACSGNKYILI